MYLRQNSHHEKKESGFNLPTRPSLQMRLNTCQHILYSIYSMNYWSNYVRLSWDLYSIVDNSLTFTSIRMILFVSRFIPPKFDQNVGRDVRYRILSPILVQVPIHWERRQLLNKFENFINLRKLIVKNPPVFNFFE